MSTGLRAGTNNDGHFQVNGTDVLTALSSGNVGIGNTNPGQKLVVSDGIINLTSTTTDTRIQFTRPNNSSSAWIGTPSWNDSALWIYGPTSSGNEAAAVYSSSTWKFYTSGAPKLTISSSGNVGIGTDNPDKRLTVSTYNEDALLIKATSTEQFHSARIHLQTGGSATDNITALVHGNNNAGGSQSYFAIESKNSSHSYIKTLALYRYTENDWRFSTGAGVPRLIIDSSGRITKPYQPLAVAGKSNATNNGTTIVFDNVYLNVGNHYDNSTGIFTCPIAGYYYVHIMMMSDNSNTTMDIALRKNDVVSQQLVPYQAATGGLYNQISGSTIIFCNANDNLRFNLNSGNTYAGTGGRHTSVIFHLVG